MPVAADPPMPQLRGATTASTNAAAPAASKRAPVVFGLRRFELRSLLFSEARFHLGRKRCEVVAGLGALLVVGLMQGLRSDEPNEDLAAARIRDCLGEVAQRAAERQVNVVIEPVNHLQVGFHHAADEVTSLVQSIGSPALGYMLDTIHMNIEERSILETIRRHVPHIRHFHVCETNGGPFGGGSLDFSSVLRELNAAGYDRFVSVKIYRALGCQDVAKQAAEFVRRLGLPGEHRSQTS
jgi:sugar phosphate isomerase/epimerase